MSKKFYPVAASLALLAVVAFAAVAQNADAVRMNAAVADFTLPDADGKEHKLSALKGAKGTAIIFVSTQCPVSNAYNERMTRLAADYQAKGVSVVGINSNVSETPDTIKAHAAEKNLTFPILKDKGNKIADRFGAQFTPEVFLLDASGKLVYHGRIDNARAAEEVNAPDLRNAMDAVIAGRAVPVAETKAFGCSIKRERAS